MKIEILMGLPGSGKSYYADREEISNTNTKAVHLDEPYAYTDNFKSRQIIDGLILTNDQLIDTIKRYANTFDKIKIIRWKPDVEACLYNDKGRRKVDSETTIKHVNVEEIDLERIKNETRCKYIEVEEKTVVRKPENFPINHKGGYILSEEWSLGGTRRYYDSNWNNVYTSEYGEDAVEFDEFNNFLEEYMPGLSFLEYKKILKEYVTLKEWEKKDYYSELTMNQYVFDLERFWKDNIEKIDEKSKTRKIIDFDLFKNFLEEQNKGVNYNREVYTDYQEVLDTLEIIEEFLDKNFETLKID